MKPSSSVNTVTELDFLLTPNTWNWTEYRPVPERGCEETRVPVSWPGGPRTWLCMVKPVSDVLHVSRSLVLVTRCWSTLYATVHLPDASFCSQADLVTRLENGLKI